MIEVLYSDVDHGRAVHVTIVESRTGHREDLSRFTCSPLQWFTLRTAIEAGVVKVRKDDHYARLDEAMFR